MQYSKASNLVKSKVNFRIYPSCIILYYYHSVFGVIKCLVFIPIHQVS